MRFRRTVVSMVLILVAGTVDAQERKAQRREFDALPITARWRVFAGGGLNFFDTRIAYSPLGLVGGSIHAEEDLGLEEEVDAYVIGAQYRLSDRHRLQVLITDLDRSATREIAERIEWGDLSFDVGVDLTTGLRTSLFRFQWKYSFSDSGRLDAGLSAGLSTFDIEASIAGAVFVDDGMGGSVLRGASEGAAFVAPVPLIGFWIDYAFSPRWIVRVSADAIDLSIGSYDGRVLETAFTAEYYVTRVVGIGFGLTGESLEFSQDDADLRIGVDYRVKALAGYLVFVF